MWLKQQRFLIDLSCCFLRTVESETGIWDWSGRAIKKSRLSCPLGARKLCDADTPCKDAQLPVCDPISSSFVIASLASALAASDDNPQEVHRLHLWQPGGSSPQRPLPVSSIPVDP